MNPVSLAAANRSWGELLAEPSVPVMPHSPGRGPQGPGPAAFQSADPEGLLAFADDRPLSPTAPASY